MRIKQIYEILRRVDTSGVLLRGEPVSNVPELIVRNIRKFKDFISKIEEIPSFANTIETLKLSSLYARDADEIRMRTDTFAEVNKIQLWLLNSVALLTENLSTVYTESNKFTITLKLPEPRDLEDMLKVLGDVETALSQNLHNEKINGEVKIESWEMGSFWIDIFVGSQQAVALVGALAWASAVVYKKVQEGRMFEEHVNGLKIKNESLDDLRNGQKQAIDLMIESEAQNLLLQHFKEEKDPEQYERLKMAIRTFAILIEHGAEIHPSLNAPEIVQNLFPKTNHLETIESQIKRIESSIPSEK